MCVCIKFQHCVITLILTQRMGTEQILCICVLLPSATKLLRLCFYRCVSVHRGGHGIPARLAGGIPACLAAGLQGGGGVLSQHALRQTPRERRLLLGTVRISLECILVTIASIICEKTKANLTLSVSGPLNRLSTTGFNRLVAH